MAEVDEKILVLFALYDNFKKLKDVKIRDRAAIMKITSENRIMKHVLDEIKNSVGANSCERS